MLNAHTHTNIYTHLCLCCVRKVANCVICILHIEVGSCRFCVSTAMLTSSFFVGSCVFIFSAGVSGTLLSNLTWDPYSGCARFVIFRADFCASPVKLGAAIVKKTQLFLRAMHAQVWLVLHWWFATVGFKHFSRIVLHTQTPTFPWTVPKVKRHFDLNIIVRQLINRSIPQGYSFCHASRHELWPLFNWLECPTTNK